MVYFALDFRLLVCDWARSATAAHVGECDLGLVLPDSTADSRFFVKSFCVYLIILKSSLSFNACTWRFVGLIEFRLVNLDAPP